MAAEPLERAGSSPDPMQQSPAVDHVSLRGITGYGHHGVHEFERERGQRFVVDVDCRVDLSRAAVSDDLRHTLDYGTLAQAIVTDIEADPLNLIEALADRIARTCLQFDPVLGVTVTVHKPEAPIPVTAADIAVTLTRSK
jgi:7,8-dihydroneopterin aldolase/epimerase/oxygenase